MYTLITDRLMHKYLPKNTQKIRSVCLHKAIEIIRKRNIVGLTSKRPLWAMGDPS